MRAAMNSSHASGDNVLIGCRIMRPPRHMPVCIAAGLRCRLVRECLRAPLQPP